MKHISRVSIAILSLLLFARVSSFGQCAAPSNVTVSTTSTTATVNFTPNGATKHVIKYKAVGSNVVTKLSNFGGSQFILQNLTACTTYNFSIRANCIPPVGTGNMQFTTTGCRLENTEETSEGLNVFPNPSNGNITVSFHSDNEQVVTISIFDVTGRIIQQHSENATSGDNQISYSTENFASGTYIIHVANSGGLLTSKFVVE